MSGTWWTRMALLAAVLLWGIWTLVPTVIGESAAEKLRRQAESAQTAADGGTGAEEGEDAASDEPWYAAVLPEQRISLGLDLQGGIDLTLQVETDEAVISSVQRDIKPLAEAAEGEGVRLAEVRRVPGEPVLLLRGEDGVEFSDINAFMAKRYDIYEYDDTRDFDGHEWHAYRITEAQATYVAERSVEQALETLRSRIDETGVKEPSIVLKGGNRINVQLPGMDDVQSAVAAIGTTAVLEFMMVDEEVDQATVERALLSAEEALDAATYNDDTLLSDWLVRNSYLPVGTRMLWEYGDGAGAQTRQRPWVVEDEIMLTGDDINDAHVAMNQYNEPYVALEFKPRGANIFAEVTGQNVGRFFAIVLDKKVSSAPRIREKIGGGRASIEMGVTDARQALADASVLSLVLRTGALPAPVTIGEVRTVGASLGADAIRAGEEATIIGFGLVFVFMVLVYRKSGVVSIIALIANVMLVMALLAAAGATLTLPGIAGIALTVGMAVDCNIIIYERIREERRLGKTARASVDAGFEKALWAVLDANITTFIAGVVLYSYGTGPIKGFAVTLMIGIVTTLFTGIFMSRILMDLMTRKAQARFSI